MTVESLKTRNDLTVDEFKQLMNKETDIKIYKKLNFLKLKAEGNSTKKAYKIANLKKSLAYRTLDQWTEGGYNALLRKPGGGRNIKLNSDQLKELKTNILSKNLTSEEDVQKYIKNKWNEEYTIAGVRNLLKTQFNINLNKNEDTIKELTTKLQKQLKELENSDVEDDDEINKLKFLISREQNAEVLKKLIYLLLRCLGFSNRFTSSLLSITTATGNNWLNKWKKIGYKGLKRKKGQGRKCKLTDKQLETLKKKLSERDNWLTWEIQNLIYDEFGVKYSHSQLIRLLKTKLGLRFAKPYPIDYRRSPYYKQTFNLRLYHKLKHHKLKYDIKNNVILDTETNEPFLIFSFDEASFQFNKNSAKMWSVRKPTMKKNSNRYSCHVAGSYSLTPNGVDDLYFMENSKKETILECFKSLRAKNPKGVILLIIDNFRSHTSNFIKEEAIKLNIELCYLPPYSPQLQPIEKIWKDMKRFMSEFKIGVALKDRKLKKEEAKDLLRSIVQMSYYKIIGNKNKWNKVLNNYIKPKIKNLCPELNVNLEVQKVSS